MKHKLTAVALAIPMLLAMLLMTVWEWGEDVRQQAALTEALSVLLDIRDGMGITGGGIDVAIAQIEALGVK